MLTRWPRAGERFSRAVPAILPVAALALLLLTILAPILLRPGYLLLHDWAWTPSGMAFTPYRAFPAGELWGSGAYPPNWLPLQAIFAALSWLLPEPVIQRLCLTALLVLLAGGAYRLSPAPGRAPRLFAATLAVVNPWTFDRLMSGQWSAVAGLGALSWALWALLRAVRRDDVASSMLAGLAWGGVGALDTHAFYLLLPVPLIVAAVHAAYRPARMRGIGRRLALVYAVAAVLSAYWLIPAAIGVPGLDRITHADLDIYATVADGRWGLAFNAASMHGFWYNDGASKAGLPIWWVLYLAILGVAAWGFGLAFRDARYRAPALAMALVGVFGWLVSIGDQGPSGPLFGWAFDHVPGMHGLRDAQRAVAFLPLVYGYLGAFAVARLAGARPGNGSAGFDIERMALVALVFLVLITYTFRIFWFGLGERHPSEFPASWSETRAIVTEHPESAVMVLPWQRFMKLPFTHDINAINPAPRYFGGTVFSGDNDLIALQSATSGDERFAYVAALLARSQQIDHFGNLLSVLGVRYIFLAHGPGYEPLRDFLDRQQDLTRVRDWPDAELYENRVPATLVYASTDVRLARDLDDLIRQSAETPLAGHVWVSEPRTGDAVLLTSPRPATVALTAGLSSKEFPVGGDLHGPYLQTAAARPDSRWSLAGARRIRTLTPVLAFEGPGAELARSGSGRLLAACAVSGAALLLVVAWLVHASVAGRRLAAGS